MSRSIKQNLFASYLAPILDTVYGTALYITGHPGEADCLVEEVSIDAFTRFSALRPTPHFKTWFLRLMVDRFRVRAGRGSASEVVPWAPGTALPGTASEASLAGVFARLPVEERIVSALYFMDDLSYSEMADVVGCPVEAVRGRLHRGRKVLSRALGGAAQPAGGSTDWLLLPAWRPGEPVSEC
jgi:RNA polymerase sigma-70 factor, ECF subfamily